MKGRNHILAGATGCLIQQWLVPLGVMAPDFAHGVAFLLRKPFPNLPPELMWLYRCGHSVLLWGILAFFTWHLHPLVPGFFMGVALHLANDWPNHAGSQPLYPIPVPTFGGWGD